MTGPAKSGFAAGRSSNGTARSSMANRKTPKQTAPSRMTKAERAAAKVERARREMREIIAEHDEDPPFEPGLIDTTRGGGMVGTPVRRKRRAAVEATDDAGEDTDELLGAAGSAAIERKVRERFNALRDYIGVDNEDYNAENANRMMLRALLSSVMELYPEAVSTYLKTRKEQAGYVVAAFSTQARDINSELRMVSDAEGQALFIGDRIVGQMFVAFAQQLLSEGMALKSTVNTVLPGHPRGEKINHALDAMMRRLGQFVDASRQRMIGDITAYLNGDLSVANSPSAGGKRKQKKRA